MRSRISTLVLSSVLILSLLACSKKEESQNPPATSNGASSAQSNPPATTTPPPAQNQAATSAPANQQQMAQQPPPQSQQQQMAPAQSPQQQQQMAQAPPPPPPLVIPAGTSLVVRMGNTIDTKTANPGDSFTGTLAHSVAVHGVVAIPAGAGVAGTVVEAKSPGRFKGEGVLSVALTSINVRGVPTSIQSSTYVQTIKGKGKRTAVMAGGGTGAGALIGGLAGGGKGALIGGLIGAGAGTAGAAFTGNKDLSIPAETVLTFRLGTPIKVKRSAPAE